MTAHVAAGNSFTTAQQQTQPETTAPQAAGTAGATGREREHSLTSARAALRGRHTRKRKCPGTFLSWNSRSPAEGSQHSPLPQTPNHIIQAPAVVQAGGRHSTASEAREEGALATAHPEAADGEGTGSQRRQELGLAVLRQRETALGGMQPAGLKGTGDRMGQGNSHRGRGCEPHPTTKALQQKQRLIRARAAHTPNLPQLQCSPSSCNSLCAKSTHTPGSGPYNEDLRTRPRPRPLLHPMKRPSHLQTKQPSPSCPTVPSKSQIPPSHPAEGIALVQPSRGCQPGLSTLVVADTPPGLPLCL